MAIYGILTLGDETLRERCGEVAKVDDTIWRLLDNMKDTMYDANGVGLAAPQIGVLKRVVVIDIEDHLLELVNPVLEKGKGKQVTYEACLSVPDYEAPVERYKQVWVKALNRDGNHSHRSARAFSPSRFSMKWTTSTVYSSSTGPGTARDAHRLYGQPQLRRGEVSTPFAGRATMWPPWSAKGIRRGAGIGNPPHAGEGLCPATQSPILCAGQRHPGAGLHLPNSGFESRLHCRHRLWEAPAQSAANGLPLRGRHPRLPFADLSRPLPIYQAIYDGAAETGVTTMYMAEGLDDGDICLQEAYPLDETMVFGAVYDALAQIGGGLLVRTLALLAAGKAPAFPRKGRGHLYPAFKPCR